MTRRAWRFLRTASAPVLAAVVVASLLVASAATLGSITAADLFTSSRDEPRCTPELTVTGSGSTFSTVTVTGFTNACNGAQLQLTIANSAGVALASGSATMSSTSVVVALSATVTASAAVSAAATINALGVPAQLVVSAPPVSSSSWWLRNTFAGGATTTQPVMPMSPTSTPLPTGALPNYSTDAGPLPGRLLTTSGANAAAIWSTAPTTSAVTFAGNSTLNIDVRRLTGGGGAATVTATLLAVNSSGATVATLGSSTASTAAGNPGASPPNEALSFTIPTAGTVPSGGAVRLRLTVTTRNIRLQYDTTTYPARLVLPATVSTLDPASLGATASTAITSDAGTSYCATVTVSTAAPWPITWTVQVPLDSFPLNGTPTSVWNATWSFAAPVLTASGAGFNNLVSAGANQTFGFCADRPPPPPAPVDSTVTITGDWGTGYCATVTVTTTSFAPVTWEVEVDLSTAPVNGAPYNVWNATWSFDVAAATLTASGAGFNNQVSASSPASFGFCANRPTTATTTWAFTAGTLAATSTPAPVTASAVTAGPGVGIFGVMNNDAGTLTPNTYNYPGAPQLRWGTSVTATTPAAAVAGGSYVEFSVTSPASGAVDLSSLTFVAARGGPSTPRGLVLRSSVDGYSADLLNTQLTTARNTWGPFNVALGTLPRIAAGATVTFRLYLYAPGTGLTAELDDLQLSYGLLP